MNDMQMDIFTRNELTISNTLTDTIKTNTKLRLKIRVLISVRR